MTMSEFFHMGGYAFYVWTSYGLTLIVLLANVAGTAQTAAQNTGGPGPARTAREEYEMRAARKKRLYLIALMVVGVGIAVTFALNAFNQNLMFFYSPSEVIGGEAPKDHTFRLGGLVTDGSVQRQSDGLTVQFDVTDTAKNVTVQYTGILPDLFREGQGIVAHGRLRDDGVFVAEEVLAKHDENYMPPEVADSLQAAHDAGVAEKNEGVAKP